MSIGCSFGAVRASKVYSSTRSEAALGREVRISSEFNGQDNYLLGIYLLVPDLTVAGIPEGQRLRP